jgi:exodeoxyribonuclease VII large subunit
MLAAAPARRRPAGSTNVAEFSVSEIALALKRTVEEAFGLVRVRGELSGFKRAASGHLYFALKDDRAVLDTVCWRGTLGKMAFTPEDGLEVICTGRLTTFPGRSKYQLVVERMEPAGIGALMALLEDRRRRLAAEGLFAPERKRPLPFLPEVVGVVTSPTGAVIRDILHRLEDRFPRRVVLWPVVVQGEGAAEQVAAAIRGFSALPRGGPVPRPDVLIVARGGGSIEDLWAFNEEVVVRAAAECSIPLVSAVGHETDTTLIDHAADRRAPTPTAAAELVVPVRRDLVAQLAGTAERQEHAMGARLRELRERLGGLGRGLARPETALHLAAQRVDDLAERLRLRSPVAVAAMQVERLEARGRRLSELAADRLRHAAGELECVGPRLVPALVARRVEELAPRLERERVGLGRALAARLGRWEEGLGALARQLEALSHRSVLERGYAIVRARSDGRLVTRSAGLGDAAELELAFADGRIDVRRIDAPPLPPSPRRQRAQAPPSAAGQGSLL